LFYFSHLKLALRSHFQFSSCVCMHVLWMANILITRFNRSKLNKCMCVVCSSYGLILNSGIRCMVDVKLFEYRGRECVNQSHTETVCRWVCRSSSASELCII